MIRQDYKHLEEQDNAFTIKPVLKNGSEKLLRIFIMKDSTMIIGATVYIAVNVKHKFLHLWLKRC